MSKTDFDRSGMSNNILFVTADSLRADACGFLNGPETTPFLSQLAKESAVFETAIAPGPRTPSSIALSHTGERFRRVDTETNEDRLERVAEHVTRFETIPERLAKQGYTTGAVTANPWTTRFDEPFDEFVKIGGSYDDSRDSRNGIQQAIDHINQWRKSTDWFAQWPSFYSDVQELVNSLPEPWFVWVFLMDTHSPYIVPRQHRVESSALTMYYSAMRYNASVMRSRDVSTLPPHLDRYLKQAYRDAVRSIDAFVEQIHQDTPSNTALIFYSDHGEAFGEHGTYGHQEKLYEENVHIPLLVHNGSVEGCYSQPISTLTIPTIAEQIAQDAFDPGSLTQEIAFSQTGDSSDYAARTTSHWLMTDSDQVLCRDTRSDVDYSLLSDGDTVDAVTDLFRSKFAVDKEKSNIVSAVEKSSLTDSDPQSGRDPDTE